MSATTIPDNEIQRLNALWALKLLDTPEEERFDRICRVAMAIFNVPMASIILIDEKRQWAKSMPGIGQWQSARDISFCAHTVSSDKPYIVEDVLLDPKVSDFPAINDMPAVRFYAGVPLSSPNKRKDSHKF